MIMNETSTGKATDDYSPDDLSASEERIRGSLIKCLSRLKKKNEECFQKAQMMGQERLMVEMTAVMSRIDGLISRMRSGLHPHRYRFGKLIKKDLDRLHAYDSELESLMSQCADLLDKGSDHKNCAAVTARLRLIEKIFKNRMTILRTMRIYG